MSFSGSIFNPDQGFGPSSTMFNCSFLANLPQVSYSSTENELCVSLGIHTVLRQAIRLHLLAANSLTACFSAPAGAPRPCASRQKAAAHGSAALTTRGPSPLAPCGRCRPWGRGATPASRPANQSGRRSLFIWLKVSCVIHTKASELLEGILTRETRSIISPYITIPKGS